MRILPLILFACAPVAADLPKDSGDTGTASDTDVDADTDTDVDADTDADADADTAVTVDPPLGLSSGGGGGSAYPGTGASITLGGVDVGILTPSDAAAATDIPFLLIYSGVEGQDLMLQNMTSLGPYLGLGDALIVVLDGRTRDAADGELVIDAVRAAYDIDNDRTWLLSESAGTGAGLELGLDLRPSFFAAYWANDVNAQRPPTYTAAALGFEPWGNVGPGGDFVDADAIVDGMRTAGYRLPADAPYSGPGAGTHGDTNQFIAAVEFFVGKSRQ